MNIKSPVIQIALDYPTIEEAVAMARIGIQAGLPLRIYNAFTGPLDLGWSRHERFGDEPCLACLYWPTGTFPQLSYRPFAIRLY